MIATVRSEWIKLRTVRMNYVLIIIAVAFPLMVSILTVVFQNVRDIDARSIVDLVTGTSVITAMLLGVIAAVSISGEFAYGTIRPTFAATPVRSQVMVAKAIVTVVVAVAVELVVVVVCLGISFAIADSRGLSVSIGDQSGNKPAIVGLVVFTAMVSLLGFGLGLLIRNTPTALSVLILWPLVVESIVGGLLGIAIDRPFRFMPYLSGINMASTVPDPEFLGRVAGGLYFGLVTIGVTLAGVALTSRKDA